MSTTLTRGVSWLPSTSVAREYNRRKPSPLGVNMVCQFVASAFGFASVVGSQLDGRVEVVGLVGNATVTLP